MIRAKAEAPTSHTQVCSATGKAQLSEQGQRGPPEHNRAEASFDYSDPRQESARRSHTLTRDRSQPSSVVGSDNEEQVPAPHRTWSYRSYFRQTTLRQKGPGYWNTGAQNAFENKTSQLPCRSRLISDLAPFFIELRAERSSASGCGFSFLIRVQQRRSTVLGFETS